LKGSHLENNLERLRNKKGLTQSALAEKVGTSQQQIQRIEKNKAECTVPMAVKIAAALDVDVGEVFPGLTIPERIKVLKRAQASDKAASPLDGKVWYYPIKFVFADASTFEVLTHEKELERIENRLWAEPAPKGFMLFDSFRAEIAVNIDRLTAWSILRDEGGLGEVYDPARRFEERDDDEDSEGPVMVICANAPEPFHLMVEPEQADADDNWVQGAFFDMDSGAEHTGQTFVTIRDHDGNYHGFRTSEILVFSAEYWVLAPVEDLISVKD
jgi:DNA-binding XRE family transcriptional regulator